MGITLIKSPKIIWCNQRCNVEPTWKIQRVQKNPRVHKIRVRNSGAGNGSPNFMDTWKKSVLSAGKPVSIKFLVLGGGVIFWVLGGGGGVPILFLWARGFFWSFARALSERFFKNWGGSRAPEIHRAHGLDGPAIRNANRFAEKPLLSYNVRAIRTNRLKPAIRNVLGLPCLQRCVVKLYWWNLIWNLKSLMWNMWCIGGKTFRPAGSTKHLGANFGANFGKIFGSFVSNFAFFFFCFGNFVQQKGGVNSVLVPRSAIHKKNLRRFARIAWFARICIRTRRIGAIPEKSDLVNFRGPD